MSTALEAELLQAAKDADQLCAEIHMGIPIPAGDACVFRHRAARLRQRAAWVRELRANVASGTAAVDFYNLGWNDGVERLTGPIPATETAEPLKETTK